jgi:hypothetical protein
MVALAMRAFVCVCEREIGRGVEGVAVRRVENQRERMQFFFFTQNKISFFFFFLFFCSFFFFFFFFFFTLFSRFFPMAPPDRKRNKRYRALGGDSDSDGGEDACATLGVTNRGGVTDESAAVAGPSSAMLLSTEAGAAATQPPPPPAAAQQPSSAAATPGRRRRERRAKDSRGTGTSTAAAGSGSGSGGGSGTAAATAAADGCGEAGPGPLTLAPRVAVNPTSGQYLVSNPDGSVSIAEDHLEKAVQQERGEARRREMEAAAEAEAAELRVILKSSVLGFGGFFFLISFPMTLCAICSSLIFFFFFLYFVLNNKRFALSACVPPPFFFYCFLFPLTDICFPFFPPFPFRSCCRHRDAANPPHPLYVLQQQLDQQRVFVATADDGTDYYMTADMLLHLRRVRSFLILLSIDMVYVGILLFISAFGPTGTAGQEQTANSSSGSQDAQAGDVSRAAAVGALTFWYVLGQGSELLFFFFFSFLNSQSFIDVSMTLGPTTPVPPPIRSLLVDFVGMTGANRGSSRQLLLFIVLGSLSLLLMLLVTRATLMLLVKALVIAFAVQVRAGFAALGRQRDQVVAALAGGQPGAQAEQTELQQRQEHLLQQQLRQQLLLQQQQQQQQEEDRHQHDHPPQQQGPMAV